MKGLYFKFNNKKEVHEILSEPMAAVNTEGYDCNRITTTIVVVAKRLADNECITADVDFIGELYSTKERAER